MIAMWPADMVAAIRIIGSHRVYGTRGRDGRRRVLGPWSLTCGLSSAPLLSTDTLAALRLPHLQGPPAPDWFDLSRRGWDMDKMEEALMTFSEACDRLPRLGRERR